MILASQLRRIVVLLLICFVPFLSHARVIELEGPGDSPEARFVQAVLERAYQRIGYEVVYRHVPLARSFIEADKGRLDGLRARIAHVADKYEGLVKVPFVLFDFKLVILADTRLCGECHVSELADLAVARGFEGFTVFRAHTALSANVLEVTHFQQALNLLKEQKVQAAVMSEPLIPDDLAGYGKHWVRRTLAVYPDFHYVNERFAHLVPALTQTLNALETEGVLHALRLQYAIPAPAQSYPQSRTDLIAP
ncbi:hypothetical protein OE749_03285 [Aestuariibacter sp. AA17]|uniref:Solute-binding protein family 3/N-terminal domain-containing protein n=1 Tax=Fluctibacter corallii TaxID=2984329 RepID=A0ABT3A4X0_9ALTE|nr:hypothetical protein [Aestuariibacter sp. AA17]MCV2883725.1 hypothetical protein [Aestuariibacter sp. AA17]